ncbi:hypothetical protein ACFFQW_04415 [Umezawaea endophytica]|uniref:Uncharacterized protein n=1 Tax=Umezawaea endophytica TaxID=1654476 RepID=A0A9X3ADR1_9PSEU|nr:hypothetical protein [Umezawaea endophytica]MCS7476387.1 hypothetical protein [Umezawaea endophytica]
MIRNAFDLATPTPRRSGTSSGAQTAALYGPIPELTERFNDLVLRHADDNGELPDRQAVEAAEIAHKLYQLHDSEADHYRRLSLEHREGRRSR